MGYFPALTEVPDQICGHLAQQLGVAEHTRLVDEVSRPATSHRYRTAVRTRLDSRPFFEGGREIVITTVRHCAQTMSDPADLISAAVEALVQANIELPAFSTLDRLVSTLRQEVQETLYQRITGTLSDEQRQTLDALLDVPEGDRLNRFSRLKQTPGPPTLKHVREWTERLAALDGLLDPRPFLKDIPHTQVRQFAAEAAALESGDLRDVCWPGRRHALLLSFLHQVQSDTRDQLVEMFVRRIRRTQQAALERLHALREQHREMEETLIGVFGQVLHHASGDRNDTDLGRSVRQVLADQGGIEALGSQFQAVAAYHHHNDLPLLWPVHAIHRTVLFRVLDRLQIESSTQDRRLLDALARVHQYRYSRRDVLPTAIDLGFASQRWQAFIQERERGETVQSPNRYRSPPKRPM